MTVNLSPTEVLAVIGVLLALVMVWRSGTRRARRAAEAAHAGSRAVSLAGCLQQRVLAPPEQRVLAPPTRSGDGR